MFRNKLDHSGQPLYLNMWREGSCDSGNL